MVDHIAMSWAESTLAFSNACCLMGPGCVVSSSAREVRRVFAIHMSP